MACKWVRFAYRFVPLSAWRALLLDRHLDHCPACRDAVLDDAAIRSLGVTPAKLMDELPLRPFAATRCTAPRRSAFRPSYAYGLFLAAVAVVAVVVVSRLVTPVGPPRGNVTVMENEDDTRVFAVLEAKIGGEPARSVVFKPGQPGMTIVWFEKTKN